MLGAKLSNVSSPIIYNKHQLSPEVISNIFSKNKAMVPVFISTPKSPCDAKVQENASKKELQSGKAIELSTDKRYSTGKGKIYITKSNFGMCPSPKLNN